MSSNQHPVLGAVPQQLDIPVEVLQVVELFESELKNVPFPDVSAASLGASLVALRSAQEAAASAALALDRAHAEATAQLAALRADTQRALAYAAIYAGADASRAPLVTHIEALQARWPMVAQQAAVVGAAATGKRRGRKAHGTGAAQLFDNAPVGDDAAATGDACAARDDAPTLAPM